MDTGNKSTTAPLFAKFMAASQPFNKCKLWSHIIALISRRGSESVTTLRAAKYRIFNITNLSVVLRPILSVPARPRSPDKTGYLGLGITTLSLAYVYFRGWRHGCGNAPFIYASIQ